MAEIRYFVIKFDKILEKKFNFQFKMFVSLSEKCINKRLGN